MPRSSSASADRILAEARLWLGTPYLHQQSTLGAGCDCLGLVRGIWRSLYGEEPEPTPPYAPDWGEADGAEPLQAAARRWLEPLPLAERRPGDVLLFRMRRAGPAKHLGVLSGLAPERMIHAWSGHSVSEIALDHPWRRRLVGVFRFPLPHSEV